MPNIWGKVAENLGMRSLSVVDERPQNAVQHVTAHYQPAYNPLVVRNFTVFTTQTFPQVFYRSYRRYFPGFTHLPHTLLLTLLFIN